MIQRRLVLLAFAAVAAFAVSRAPSYPLHHAAARAIAGQRPFVLRLMGSRTWRPCTPAATARPTVCAEYKPDAQLLQQLIAVARSAERNSGRSDPPWATATTRLAIAHGDSSDGTVVARATDDLAHLVAGHETAGMHNDLAVALVANPSAQLARLLAALDHIERAATLDPESPVIAFNRAWLLDRLSLYEEAAHAWRRYMVLEPDSAWNAEAKSRLTILEARSFADSTMARLADDPQRERATFFDTLLAAWAGVARQEQGRRRAAVHNLDSAAWRIARRNGDSTTVHVAREVAMHGSRIAPAVEMYAIAARRAKIVGADDTVAASMHTAVGVFRVAGAHALAGWADLLLARDAFYRMRYEQTEQTTAAVEQAARERHDLALVAMAQWLRALTIGKVGRMAEAAVLYDEASSLFASIGEQSHSAALRGQMADALYFMGQDDAALAARGEMLSGLAHRRSASLRAGSLLGLARWLQETGFPAAAITVLQEAVRSAEYSRNVANDRPEALVRLAEVEGRLGRTSAATHHLDSARALIAREPSARGELVAGAQEAMATIVGDRRGLALRDSVVGYYESRSIAVGRARSRSNRARSYLALGRLDAATRDLDLAASTIERLTLLPSANARDLAAANRDLYQRRIEVALAEEKLDSAFLIAERSRGERAARLPRAEAGRVILNFWTLPRETVLWIVSDRGMRAVRIHTTIADLRAQVEELESAIRAGVAGPTWDRLSRAAFRRLIAPAAPELAAAREVAILTDGPLDRLPFAALQDADGRYLIEYGPLVYRATSGDRVAVSPRSDRMAVVANPLFDAKRFRDTRPLVTADSEGIAIASLHRGTRLSGPDATKAATIALLKWSTMFHFAGHARIVDRVPEQSHLVLAADRKHPDDDMLTAAEIRALPLTSLSLVVLSSCGTTQRGFGRDPTEAGLARSFLDAGASAVISSLWATNDAATTGLMLSLHHDLAAGISPERALQRAQVALIKDERDRAIRPGVWTAFRYETR